MNKTTYDRGLEQGIELGIEQGSEKTLQRSILRTGRKKFGNPTAEVEHQVQRITNVAQLEFLVDRILDVTTWEALLHDA